MFVCLMLAILSCTFLEDRESTYIIFFVCGCMYLNHLGLWGKIENVNVSVEETETVKMTSDSLCYP